MSIKFLNGIDVDNGVLYTDTSNNRVGINTSSPQVPLEVKYTGSVDEIIRIVGTASGKPQLNFYNDTTLHTKIVAAGNNDFSISNTHSTGDMFFATGGSTRLHIEANGNVGIGTTSPSEKLGVFGNIRLENGAQRNIIGPTNENLGIFANPNGADEGILFSTDNGTTTEMIILNGGNVGIGTTSPSQKLEVNGNIELAANWQIGSNDGSYWQRIRTEDSSSLTANAFNFETRNGSGAFLNHLTILNNGNVGIGKTNPSVKLHIGPGTAPSSTTEEFRIQTGVSGGYGGTAVINLLTGQYGNSGIYFGDQATYSNQPAFIEFQDSPSTLIYKAPATSGSHVFKIGTSEQVKIAYNGYVGIGMSNPGAKLHVGVSTGSSSTTQEFLLQTQSGGYGGEAIVNLRTGQYGTSGIYFGDGLSHTSQPAYLKFIDSSNSLGLKTTGTFSLTVNSSVEMYVSAVGLGVGTTSPGEKLEVNGTVKATATTDAYKGYIKNTINTIVHEKSASADFNYVPFNTVSTGNSNQYYNAFVAPYNGRVKKIHVRHSGGNTPTATAVRFKKQVNGTLSSTQYQATISNGATTNMQAEYNFSNSDFTFNEGDLLRIAMQTSDAFGTGSRTMGGGAVAIVLEYNIT